MQVQAEAVTLAMKMGEKSVQAAEYVRDRIADHPTLSKNTELRQVVDKYVASVKFMHESIAPVWSGVSREIDPVKNMLANQGASFAQDLKGSLGQNIQMSIAISEKGGISRAFTQKLNESDVQKLNESDVQKLNEKDTAKMDGMMQAWFSKNNYGFHNGQIVDLKSLERNEIKPISESEIVKLRNDLLDESTGIKSFCTNSGVPVGFTLYEQRDGKLIEIEQQERRIKELLQQEKEAARVTEEAAPTQAAQDQTSQVSSRQ
jgi:hypothetical protein